MGSAAWAAAMNQPAASRQNTTNPNRFAGKKRWRRRVRSPAGCIGLLLYYSLGKCHWQIAKTGRDKPNEVLTGTKTLTYACSPNTVSRHESDRVVGQCGGFATREAGNNRWCRDGFLCRFG